MSGRKRTKDDFDGIEEYKFVKQVIQYCHLYHQLSSIRNSTTRMKT